MDSGAPRATLEDKLRLATGESGSAGLVIPHRQNDRARADALWQGHSRSPRRADAVFSEEGFRLRAVGGDAGGGDGFGAIELRGDLLVQGEELGEEVGLGGKAVGREDGGIEGGVGVLERVGAGEFAAGDRCPVPSLPRSDPLLARPALPGNPRRPLPRRRRHQRGCGGREDRVCEARWRAACRNPRQ